MSTHLPKLWRISSPISKKRFFGNGFFDFFETVYQKSPLFTIEERAFLICKTKATRQAGGSVEAFAVEQSRRGGRLSCVKGGLR